jgi:hypothetical protein
MAIELASTLRQLGRSGNVSTSAYFPLVESQDVNFSVEKVMVTGSTLTSPLATGQKYIIGAGSSLTPPNTDINDIVRYTGYPSPNEWELYLDVSNTETNYGIVFDRERKLFLQYSSDEQQWIPMLKSGMVDGGTFGA